MSQLERMHFRPDAARLALAGDSDGLNEAFTWSRTPQGQAFWVSENKALELGEGLSPEAAVAIRGWLGDDPA